MRMMCVPVADRNARCRSPVGRDRPTEDRAYGLRCDKTLRRAGLERRRHNAQQHYARTNSIDIYTMYYIYAIRTTSSYSAPLIRSSRDSDPGARWRHAAQSRAIYSPITTINSLKFTFIIPIHSLYCTIIRSGRQVRSSQSPPSPHASPRLTHQA